MSYVCAQDEMNCIRLEASGIKKQIINNTFTSFTLTEAGIKVSYEVDYSGFFVSSSGVLVHQDAEKRNFHLVFTMERV